MTGTRRVAHRHPHLVPARNLTSDLQRLWRVVALLAVATAAALLVMATSAGRELVDGLDRTWHGWMVDAEAGAAVTAATVFAAIGSVWVTVPLRVGVGLWLAWRRRWARLTVWLAAIALSEPAIGLLKAGYERPRPPLGLAETDTFSFPSGHAVAGAVIAVTLVAVLTQPGLRRWHWWGIAVAFSAAMATSRTYLRVHWLTDVVAGTMIGATLGLLAVALVASYRPAKTPSRTP